MNPRHSQQPGQAAPGMGSAHQLGAEPADETAIGGGVLQDLHHQGRKLGIEGGSRHRGARVRASHDSPERSRRGLSSHLACTLPVGTHNPGGERVLALG
jgi:hypothetical protein